MSPQEEAAVAGSQLREAASDLETKFAGLQQKESSARDSAAQVRAASVAARFS